MIKHAFTIWLGIMIVFCVFHIENRGEFTKPTKHWNLHDSTKQTTWSNPDNIKQIKKRYKL